MGSTIQTNDGRYYQKPSIGATIGGIASGSIVANTMQAGLTPIGLWSSKQMRKIAQTTNPNEIRPALYQAVENSGLKDKLKILDLKDQEIPTTAVKTLKEKILSFLKPKIDIIGMASRGENAFFQPINKQIVINTDKLGIAGFHEVGHAMNFNNSKILKTIQKMRPQLLFGIPSLILAISLFKRKKAPGEKPKGFFDKTTTFIKENAGKLAALSIVPIVIEELVATKKGNTLAKQLLSPENFKKVIKANRWGAISYIGGTILIGTSVWLANKVKDAIAGPKEIEPQE